MLAIYAAVRLRPVGHPPRLRPPPAMASASSSTAWDARPRAGAEEPGAEHAGAVEPRGDSQLSAVLTAVQSQVPQSVERDRVLGAGRLLASSANKATLRSLAGKWDVRQKVGGKNRGTTDLLNEIEEKVRRAATRLLQQEEVREANVSQSGSDAVALTEPTADESLGQGVAAAANTGNDAAALTEPAAESSIGRSTSQKRAVSPGQGAAAANCMPGQSEISRQSKKPGHRQELRQARMCQKRRTTYRCR